MTTALRTLKGKVVLVYFPFTDLSGRKLRPAVVLYDNGRDVVVAFISSRVEKYKPDTDIMVRREHPEFVLTGLKTDSIIKLTKMATLHRKLIAGEIGEVGEQLRNEINKKLLEVLTL